MVSTFHQLLLRDVDIKDPIVPSPTPPHTSPKKFSIVSVKHYLNLLAPELFF